MSGELSVVALEKDGGTNVICGQSHFIETVEDIHELMASVPTARFGIAFCEASGPCLIRHFGERP